MPRFEFWEWIQNFDIKDRTPENYRQKTAFIPQNLQQRCSKTHSKADSCQFYTASAASLFRYGRRRWASLSWAYRSEPKLLCLIITVMLVLYKQLTKCMFFGYLLYFPVLSCEICSVCSTQNWRKESFRVHICFFCRTVEWMELNGFLVGKSRTTKYFSCSRLALIDGSHVMSLNTYYSDILCWAELLQEKLPCVFC